MSAAGAPVLEVRDLAIAVGGHPLIDGIGFGLGRGEVLSLVGESGCGKSLTAFALTGLLPPAAQVTGGQVRLGGRDLIGLPEAELRRLRGRDIALIFQEPIGCLDPLMTIGDQLIEALRAHQPLDRRAARDEAARLLRLVRIAEPERRLANYPHELSGGMCQRVMIATALAGRPAVLIADEPTTALDVTIQAQILELMRALCADAGTAVLLITHDMGVVADMADRVAVMYAGRIVELAPVEPLFARPHHPYTDLLLKSVPSLEAVPKAPLATIDGSVPPAGRLPPGCRFAPRCPDADARCRAESPSLAPIGAADGGRLVACFHPRSRP